MQVQRLYSVYTNNIMLGSASFALDTEVARAQLEERAARVQSSMREALGKPDEAIQRRRATLQVVLGSNRDVVIKD